MHVQEKIAVHTIAIRNKTVVQGGVYTGNAEYPIYRDMPADLPVEAESYP